MMRFFKSSIIALSTVVSVQAAIAQDTLMTEDFSDMSLPAGWENINNFEGSSGIVWAFDNPTDRGGAAGFMTPTADNGFAILDSDGAGADAAPHDADLISPSVNLNAYDSTVTLIFSHYFNSAGDDSGVPFPATGQIGEVLINNGSGWEQVAIYEGPASSVNGETVTIDVSAQALGKPNFKVKFNWTSGYEQYWMVDDVFIIATKTANAPEPAIAPVTSNDSAKTDTSMSVDIFVLVNDTAKDNPMDTSSLEVMTGPKFGSNDVNDSLGFITYTPLPGYEGMDSLSYTISDTSGNPSNESWVYITIEASEVDTIVDTTSTNVTIYTGEKINFFPNPAKDVVNFDLPAAELNEVKTVSIYNLAGRQLFFVETKNNQINLPTSLNSGVYMVKIKTPSSTYLGKLIKN
jgi:hypothetical protein